MNSRDEDKQNSEQLLQQPQLQGGLSNEKKGRRTRTDPNNRSYICGCGKSYLSYPALYTHIKQKHDGKQPPDTKKPEKTRGQRGRPTTTASNQIQDGQQDNFEQDDDNLSSDSNDALNVIEELVLYLFQELGKDSNIILQENQSNSLSDIRTAFPINIFEDHRDYSVILSRVEDSFLREGQIDEEESNNGIVSTKCNSVFGLFIFSVGKHLKEYALKELIFYCCLFRKALNEKGWQILQELGIGQYSAEEVNEEFCEANNAQHVLEISNEFITDILPNYLEKYSQQTPEYKLINTQNLNSFIIKITQYFCSWLYARRYTNSMLERNDEEDS